MKVDVLYAPYVDLQNVRRLKMNKTKQRMINALKESVIASLKELEEAYELLSDFEEEPEKTYCDHYGNEVPIKEVHND